eukprot:15455482-Alexandrium_andersonii.AAC.1
MPRAVTGVVVVGVGVCVVGIAVALATARVLAALAVGVVAAGCRLLRLRPGRCSGGVLCCLAFQVSAPLGLIHHQATAEVRHVVHGVGLDLAQLVLAQHLVPVVQRVGLRDRIPRLLD